MFSLNLPNADITYFPEIFNTKESSIFYTQLLENIPWRQDEITVFGKTYPQPRLTALYATNNLTYSYSGIKMEPLPFTNTLNTIKEKVETISGNTFTTCLLNLYRNGQDSNGWHADNEKELGKNPIIASVSFGEKRLFKLKHKSLNLKHDLELENGSLLLMKGTTQHHWLHSIPKTRKQKTERINLTFRIIK
ncbi:alpha-ketoglutarate-dependent dioxygenase AlkB family protein [Neptunitalea chrysea]|nr:alpha-ketoglutarate-dependent dioxygenase AlkB [Neptunitalea chrysea]